LNFEDFDLSLRLGQHGKLAFLPSMRIVHAGGHAARKGLRHITLFIRSGFRFFKQWGWRWL
jgi:GT2 family glycosyltransferase